jgi:hypothetical protein
MRNYLALLGAFLLFVALPAQAQQVTPNGEQIICYDCDPDCNSECGIDGGHEMDWTLLFGVSGNHDFCVCFNGCGHPPCGGAAMTDDERDEFYAAIDGAVDGNFEPVLEAVDDYPQYAVLNLDRNHLQIQSPCEDGVIVASIPLTSAQVAAVYSRQPGISTLASR